MYSFKAIAFLTMASVGFQVLAHEEKEIVVGRNAAGEIKVEMEFSQPVELEESVFPGISGHATGELAFHSTLLDSPTNDFFQLSTAADFRFVLLAKDPGMEVWNDTGSGFMGIGESFYIGPSPFDSHPVWNLVTGIRGNSYSLTMKLHDLNGIYPDSTPFTLSFALPDSFEIKIAPIDDQHALLSWPTNAEAWELQSTETVTATNWTAVTNPPSIVGTNFSLSIPSAGVRQFFRLHRHEHH
jgi:hypothetical protein